MVTTTSDELLDTARKCLAVPSSALAKFVSTLVTKRHLLNALAQQYLDQVRHAPLDIHVTAADPGGGQLASEFQPAGAAAAPGQGAPDIHGKGAGSTPSRRKKWTPPPPRSEEHRQAARATAQSIMRNVFDDYRINRRPIGNFRWRELGALSRENAYNAAGMLDKGLAQTTHAVLCRNLLQYCRPTDDAKLIREIVAEDKLKELIREADVQARQLVAYGTQHQAQIIQNPMSIGA